LIETAIIRAPSRAADRIYGRTLLERAITNCQRNGISKIFVEAGEHRSSELAEAMGQFYGRPNVEIVGSMDALSADGRVNPTAPCVVLEGNVIFTAAQLRNLISKSEEAASRVIRLKAHDGDDGSITAGPFYRIVDSNELARQGSTSSPIEIPSNRYLPFALNGRPEDAEEAETRLARALRFETIATDGLLARLIDRKISWRLSRPLARIGISPNTVTLANTLLGFGCAALFASTSYWQRVLGAFLFLVAVTIDGVDGEVARLRMAESKAGARLDRITDNIVHIAIFTGLMIGCHRITGSTAYFYLLAILLSGFGLCAIAVERALRIHGDQAQRWLSQVERWSGRDFAYLLAFLTIINKLAFFCWGTAFGTWVFALVLWWLTDRRLGTAGRHTQPGNHPATAEEV
jgi:phosphatidylglycerophosphate synthase